MVPLVDLLTSFDVAALVVGRGVVELFLSCLGTSFFGDSSSLFPLNTFS